MREYNKVCDLFSFETKIGLIAKDAGAANLMAYAFKQFDNTLVYCEEPGRSIFKGLDFVFATTFEEVLTFSDIIIIGTGSSNFEKSHLYSAKQLEKNTFSVLDHWINYKERFKFGKTTIDPNKLLVFDQDAEDMARLNFPNTPVLGLVNEYQEYIRNAVQKIPNETAKKSFLYIHEKINGDFDDLKGKEYWEVCFDRFYSQVSMMHDEFQIKFRIHPKDNPKEFKKILYNRQNVVVSSSDLAFDIAQSDVIVGVRSAALEIARNCGKPVFTTNINSSIKLPGPLARLPIFAVSYTE